MIISRHRYGTVQLLRARAVAPESAETTPHARELRRAKSCQIPRRAPVRAQNTAYPGAPPDPRRSALNHYLPRPRARRAATQAKASHHDQLRSTRNQAAAADRHEIRLPRGRHGVGRPGRSAAPFARQDGLVQRGFSWVSSIRFTREPRVVGRPRRPVP